MEYEYSLVFFTIFGQLAAGITLMISVAGMHRFATYERQCWLAATVFLGLAFAASLFHLQNPFHAPYTVTQIDHAWLSREILSGGIFGLFILARLVNILKAGANAFLALVALLFVLVMSQIYVQNDIVPTWNNAGTVISFLAAMILAGSTAICAFYAGEPDGRINRTCLSGFVIGALGSTVMPDFWVKTISQIDPLITQIFSTAVVCMSLTQATAIAVGGIALVYGYNKCRGFRFTGLVLVISGLIVGRMMFYASNLKIGF